MADPKGHNPKLPIGTRYCQCPSCREYFRSDSAFTAHRKGGECLTTEQMEDKGMVWDGDYWIKHRMGEGVR